MLKTKLKTEEEIDRFVQHILTSGWDIEDVESFNRQASNHYRPSLEVFLFNSEHVIDQLRLQQGVYTNFQDTPSFPNYAIRHKGQWELGLRRMTPGDVLMLQAAQMQNMTHEGRDVAENQPKYWQHVWRQFLFTVLPDGIRSSHDWLFDDMRAAMCASYQYAMHAMKYEEDRTRGLIDAFGNDQSPFYTGVVVHKETKRIDDGFVTGWNITRMDDGYESLAMTALIVACYGIDTHARAALDGYLTLNGKPFHQFFVDHLKRNKKPPEYFTIIDEDNHGHTKAEQDTGPATGGVPVNRLIP